jgi:hypothetical protein
MRTLWIEKVPMNFNPFLLDSHVECAFLVKRMSPNSWTISNKDGPTKNLW